MRRDEGGRPPSSARRAVVIARHYYPTQGAATNRLLSLVHALHEARWQVTVVTRSVTPADHEGECPERSPLGETILRVHGDQTTGASFRRAIDLMLFSWLSFRAAWGLPSPQLVIADPPPLSGLSMLLLARHHAASSLYYLADSWQDLVAARRSPTTSVTRRALHWLETAVWRRADLTVAVTDELGRRAALVSQRVAVVRNGVNRLYSPRVRCAPIGNHLLPVPTFYTLATTGMHTTQQCLPKPPLTNGAEVTPISA